MTIKRFALALGAALLSVSAAFAEGAIEIRDPYARTSRPGAPTGAAFMVLANTATQPDRLLAARSDVAQRVELHTHKMDANGVAAMVEIEGGIAIPAGGEHVMKRGGDHVMFMGLNRPLAQGDMVSVTLSFENAGDITVEIPVDLTR